MAPNASFSTPAPGVCSPQTCSEGPTLSNMHTHPAASVLTTNLDSAYNTLDGRIGTMVTVAQPNSIESKPTNDVSIGMDKAFALAKKHTEPNMHTPMDGMSTSSSSDTSRTMGVFASAANLSNACIGAGILAVPFAYSEGGWLLTSIILFIFILVTIFGMHLLSKCAHHLHTQRTSYGQLAEHTCPKLALVGDLAVFFFTYGAITSYFIVVGGLMPQAVGQIWQLPESSFLLDRRFWMTVSLVLFAIPLTCMKKTDKLAYTSSASIVFLFYFMILALLFLFAPAPSLDPCVQFEDPAQCNVKGEVVAVNSNIISILKSLPICVYAFAGHTNIFIIYNEVRHPSVHRMDVIIAPAMAVVYTLVVCFGLFGYLTYGSKVRSNVLESYPPTTPITVARIGVSFCVSVTYPLLAHACRSAAIHAIENVKAVIKSPRQPTKTQETENDIEISKKGKSDEILYWAVTVFILSASYVVALFVDNLGIVFSLIGSTAASLMVFVLPGVCYYRMFGGKYSDTITSLPIIPEYTWQEAGRKYGAIALVVFGVIFTPVSLALVFVPLT